jgi:signal transduction histidine kinase
MPEEQQSGLTAESLQNRVADGDLDVSRLLEETRASQHRAEQAVRARDLLLAVVSHDLRNPMNTLSLSIAALSQCLAQSGDDRVTAQVQRMRRSLAAMERLIGDLVDIGSIESGALYVRITEDDLTSIVDDALDLLRPLAAERDQELWVDVPSGIMVRADRQRIMQVLSNIVGNAIKFTPPHGWIRLTGRLLWEAGRPMAQIEVADSGKGIHPEDLPRIFDRFWRGDRQQGGMGLGLSIAKAVVEAHGGRLWAESPAGEGAVFRFTLPAV